VPNQWTKKREMDAMAAHVAVGPSHEEVEASDAEIRAKREAEGYPRVEFVRDATDKEIFEKRNDLEFDPWSELSPLEAAVESVKEPGMSYKLLSNRACGLLGGTRGYEPVKDANGELVKVGDMFLGKIPERIAQKRQQRYQDESSALVKSMQESYADKVERLKHDAKELGLTVLESGDSVSDKRTGRTYETGIVVERGEKGFD
jgi:hypothetical protein